MDLMITDLSRDFLVYRGYQGPKATLDYYWFRVYGRCIIAPRTEPQSKTWQAQQQAQQAQGRELVPTKVCDRLCSGEVQN